MSTGVDRNQYDKYTRKFLGENTDLSAETKEYELWIEENEKGVSRKLCNMEYMPLFSVIIPVYNVTEEQLTACICSVQKQTYQNWELWLVDDCSTWKCVRNTLERYEHEEIVHIIYRTTNGNISEATNDGIQKANGEFIAFMDCDDTIAPNALAEMAGMLNQNREYDFIYSDEDKLSEDGSRRHSPFFKPDWSPDTFLSLMYTSHLAIYRTELVRKTGGLRTEFNGAQDYDFTLRFMELSDNQRVGHIPKVLYHWREREESTASGMTAKPYALDAAKRLKEQALERRQIRGMVRLVEDMYQYRVIYNIPKPNPLVSIIIPSKDHFEILKQCIDSIYKLTSYKNYEIIVVDNGSQEAVKGEIQQYLDRICASQRGAFSSDQNVWYIYKTMEFNFSKMCNIGVEKAQGEYILLLNDDIEIFQPDWIEILLGQAMQNHTGAVGAKLLYPGTRDIQHIGVINLKPGPSHSYCGFSDEQDYYFGRNKLNYNWLAVTGACLMVKKNRYWQAGGMDEKLAVAYNDMDFCFCMYEMGYYNCVRNDVVLYHHESLSRGYDNQGAQNCRRQKELLYLYEKHPTLKEKDPFYNVNLVADQIDFSINLCGSKRSYAHGMQLKRMPAFTKRKLLVHIDKTDEYNDLFVKGWCTSGHSFWDNRSRRYLLLRSETGRLYQYEMGKTFRPDVAQAVSHAGFLSGFEVRINRNILMMDTFIYQIGILQESASRKYMVWLDIYTKKKPFIRNNICMVVEEEKNLWQQQDMHYHLDEFRVDENGMYVRGWAVVQAADNLDFATQLYIKTDVGEYLSDVHSVPRYDVALCFPEMSNLYMCGFEAENLDAGQVNDLWVLKKHRKSGRVFYVKTDIGNRDV